MTSPLKLKIELKNLPHKCLRTLLVPQDINMLQLHRVIQEAFGWFHIHLFEFNDKKSRPTIQIGASDPLATEQTDTSDAHKVLLKDAFADQNKGKSFWYWYDFGDDWWHSISFQKVTQKDLKTFSGGPICVKAQGKCPPEDVGGPGGYAAFLQAIKNKNHPRHQEMREWYGLEENETYKENEIDIGEILYSLKALYNSEDWTSDSYDPIF